MVTLLRKSLFPGRRSSEINEIWTSNTLLSASFYLTVFCCCCFFLLFLVLNFILFVQYIINKYIATWKRNTKGIQKKSWWTYLNLYPWFFIYTILLLWHVVSIFIFVVCICKQFRPISGPTQFLARLDSSCTCIPERYILKHLICKTINRWQHLKKNTQPANS